MDENLTSVHQRLPGNYSESEGKIPVCSLRLWQEELVRYE